jgi:hypothetical protein
VNLDSVEPGVASRRLALNNRVYVEPDALSGAIFTSTGLNACAIGAATRSTVAASYIATGTSTTSIVGILASNNDLTGTAQSGMVSNFTANSAATLYGSAYRASPNTAAASFTCSDLRGFHFQEGGTKGAGSTITRHIGYDCEDVTLGTTNIAYKGQVTAGANKFNLSMGGTAQNFLEGTTLIGTPSNAFGTAPKLEVWQGASSANGFAVVSQSSAHAVAVFQNRTTTGDGIFQEFYTESTPSLRGSIDYNRGGGLVRYNTTSDRRSKRIIGPITDALDRVMMLRPSRVRMIGATEDIDAFVADEAQRVSPYAVSGFRGRVGRDLRPIMQGVDNSAFVPLLTAALQQAVRDIRAIRSHVGMN